MDNSAISISPGNNISSVLPFASTTEYLPQKKQQEKKVFVIYEYENDSFPIPYSEINSIIKNFQDIDFLNAKFDELREKEIDNKITNFEKILLYDILEKIMEIIKRYNLIEKKEARENKEDNSKKKSWFNLFSWLG